MYLKKIVCENMGPIAWCDIEPGFNSDGSPKPLILVGKNGTGKSILISNIVDSFFEFGNQAYNDLTKKNSVGYAYYKIASSNQISMGQKGMICILNFSEAQKPNNSIEFIFHVGDIDIESFKSKISGNYSVSLYNSSIQKNYTNDKKIFEKEFRDNVMAYFPPERYAIPYWMGNAYSVSNEYGSTSLSDNFVGILNKPVIIENPTEDNIKWLIDVLIDAKGTLSYSGGNNFTLVDPVNSLVSLMQCKANIEKLVSEILENKTTLRLDWRNRGKERIRLFLNNTQNPLAPTMDALSTGQITLLNIFLTILRYAEPSDITNSISLEKITGIVVIDEIDLHLHSDLQRKVLPRLIKLFPKVQFIITTHSPLFLLGMRDTFSNDGYDIFEMPTGNKITAEDFSELGKAYDAITATSLHQANLRQAIQDYLKSINNALIITEGSTDWKHMKRAWNKLKNRPEYKDMDGKFEFLEYEPLDSKKEGTRKMHLSDSELTRLCEETAKIPHPNIVIFISDHDISGTVAKFSVKGKDFKSWGNNVFSFPIPIPKHREKTPDVCIEHYYTDEEIKTKYTENTLNIRLFMGNEFDENGYSSDNLYLCSNPIKIKNPISIIDGTSDLRVTLINNPSHPNVALSKMKFAEAILNEQEPFSTISSEHFTAIFDIIKQILLSNDANNQANTNPQNNQ